MTERSARLVAWSLFGLSAALLLAGVILAIVDPHSGGPANPSSAGPTLDDTVAGGGVPFAVFEAVIFSVLAGAGAIVAARRPRNPIGWLFGVAALGLAVLVLSDTLYWHAAFGDPGPHATAEVALWVENWAWIPVLVALFSFVPLLFPTGAPPSPRWRFVGWVAGHDRHRHPCRNRLQPGAAPEHRVGDESARPRRARPPHPLGSVVHHLVGLGARCGRVARRSLPPLSRC